MSNPHDHHFIPAFYLKQWAGADKKLVEYALARGKLIIKHVGPRATGFETDLNTFPDLPREIAQHLETSFFAYSDTMASIALDNHIAFPQRPWTSVLLTAWSRFVVGILLRHPDTMPELRAAAAKHWDESGVDKQAEYERIRKPEDPLTFDEHIARRDPLVRYKMQLNLIIKALDNEIVGQHIINMRWAVLDLRSSANKLLTSDRPVEMFALKEPRGVISMPISPRKLFVATNNPETFIMLERTNSTKIVREINMNVVKRARRFVWACDERQARFIRNHMSTDMERAPFFPQLFRPGPVS